MSGIIHSLRTLFGSPPAAENTRGVTTRHRAREQRQEEEEDNLAGSDDDVFSTFSNDEEENDDDDEVRTQEDGDDDADDDDNDNEMQTQPLALEEGDDQHQQQQQSESTTTTAGGQSLATQAASSTTTNHDVADRRSEENNNQEGTNTIAAAASNMDDNVGEDEATDQLTECGAPLSDFFAHLTGCDIDEDSREKKSLAQYAYEYSNDDKEKPMSFTEYKAARKANLHQYLTHRLIGNDDSDSDDSGSGKENDIGVKESAKMDDDDNSFSSNVLDEPFIRIDGDGDKNDNQEEGDEGEDEDDDDIMQLETQPQTAPVAMEEDSPEVEDEEEDETPLKTQEELTPSRLGIFSGIKRKLGFVVTTSGENQSQQSEENESSQIKKKRARTDSSISNSNSNNHDAHRKQTQTKRGLMWDGKYKSIPHVQDATFVGSNLEELDLLCQSLDLSLCRVLRVWDIRSTKRTNKLMLSSEKNDGEGGSNDNNAEVARGGIIQAAWNAISPKRRQTAESDAEVVHHPSAMTPYCEFHEDDGPLNTIYKRVFSIELAQIIENDDTATDSSITNMATAAFHDGKERLDREKARKQRHSIRKIRVFFYNRFADVMAGAFYALKKESLQKKKNVPFLMALTNIPAECIMPLAMGSNPHLQQYIMNPIGDDEYGVSSPYCICVGDKSSIRLGDDGPKLCFDHEELEMRLVEAPVNIPLAVIDNEGNSDFVLDDAIITSESIKYGNGYCMEGEQSNLVKKYVQIRKSKSDGPVLFNLEEEEEEVEELPRAETTVPNPPGLAGLRGSGGTATNNGGGESRATGESTAEGGDLIVRPKTVASLSDLQTLLIRNNMQKLTNRINVYGVVLGFSPPSLTRSEEWMMSIVLIDETIPLSNQIETRGQPNTNEGGETSNPKEMHVPSITLMIFSKDKSKLPVVRAAGDVICCEKVILQAWNGDAQLCARTHRGSNIVVVNPAQPRRPGDEIQNLPSSLNDWSASPSSGVTHSIRHLPLVNSLWRWGQQRLSSHPTMSPNCYLSIAGVGGDDSENIEVSASGDLTAVVTAIIPTPQHLRRRDTPRGYIRLWDGTGPSRSDP